MKFSHCGRLLATGGQDGVLRVWVVRDAFKFFNELRIKYNDGKLFLTSICHQHLQSFLIHFFKNFFVLKSKFMKWYNFSKVVRFNKRISMVIFKPLICLLNNSSSAAGKATLSMATPCDGQTAQVLKCFF